MCAEGLVSHVVDFLSGDYSCTTSVLRVMIGNAGILSDAIDLDGNLAVCAPSRGSTFEVGYACLLSFASFGVIEKIVSFRFWLQWPFSLSHGQAVTFSSG